MSQASENGPDELPRLYGELASWWPLLSAPEDYAEEAAFYGQQLTQACIRKPRTLLELGCGGGSNASHLKADFELTLTDAAPGMLEVSRALNPQCEHMLGDMRSLRLKRRFDLVFLHDAVCYLTTETDLRRAIETAFVHCEPGGAALFAPDFTRESFRPGTDCGGHDGGSRALRYLEWTWDPDPGDSSYVVDYVYALRDGTGPIRTITERHLEGLFSRDAWLLLLGDAGFAPSLVPFEHSEVEPGAHELFLCRKP